MFGFLIIKFHGRADVRDTGWCWGIQRKDEWGLWTEERVSQAPRQEILAGLPWWLRQWRICLQCGKPGFDPWVGKISWRRAWQPTPGFLPGGSHRQRSLVGYIVHRVIKNQTWLSDYSQHRGYRKKLSLAEALGVWRGRGEKSAGSVPCRVFVNLRAVRSCRESQHRWPYPSWEESDKKGPTSFQSGSTSPPPDGPEGGTQQPCAPVPRLYNEENAPASYLGEAPAVDQSGGNFAFNKKAREKSQDSSGF